MEDLAAVLGNSCQRNSLAKIFGERSFEALSKPPQVAIWGSTRVRSLTKDFADLMEIPCLEAEIEQLKKVAVAKESVVFIEYASLEEVKEKINIVACSGSWTLGVFCIEAEEQAKNYLKEEGIELISFR